MPTWSSLQVDMSSTERSRKLRERLKQSPSKHQAFLEKERKRDKMRREKAKLAMQTDANKLKLKRLKDRERQRRHREKLKLSSEEKSPQSLPSTMGSYQSNRSLGKAVSKVKKTLPSSPRKRKAVVAKLFADELPELKTQLRQQKFKNKIKCLAEETQNKIKEFYLRDDISRKEPGRKDVISIKNPETGQREQKQKCFMMMTISEAYEQFVAEYPECVVKKSKFFYLRPPFVLPVSCMPHNVCVCRYHANMQYLVESVAKETSPFPNSVQDLINILVCDSESYECMSSSCNKCNSEVRVRSFIDQEVMDNELKWTQWKEVDGRPQALEEIGTVADCIKQIEKQLSAFKIHTYVKRKQAKHFEDAKTNFDTHDLTLQIDYAENYTAVHQDEIQSAHFSHQQTTIFTAVAWTKDDLVRSYAIISDDLSHNKYSVWAMLELLFQELKREIQNLRTVKIFSDGCAAQFKNRFTLLNLTYLQTDFGVTGDWNFFATSHGKGAVDGVGGAVKRTVWQAVKSRRAVINTPYEFYMCAKEEVKGVKVLYVSAERVKSAIPTLDTRWKDVQPIPGLHKHHFIAPVKEGVIKVSATSVQEYIMTVSLQPHVTDENEPVCSSDAKDVSLKLTAGDFVLSALTVTGKSHSKRNYFAEVIQIDEETEQVLLKYMHPSGKCWIWPNEEDKSWENISVIIKKVEPPRLLNNRGQFVFH